MALAKACIFDLDGVVVDTAKYHYLAWKRLAEELGFDFTKEDNELLKGVSRVRSFQIILEIGGKELSEEAFQEAMDKKNKWYLEYIYKMTPEEILPGVSDFLSLLKDNGIKIALGSASKNAKTILEQIKMLDAFDAIVDGTHVSKPKPDPEVFLIGAKELGVEPTECVVFEDAIAGVEAAKNGNMHCIGVGDPEVLGKADFVISTFEGLGLDRIDF
ncbi:beta-phosphoglucomutase [Flammeovirgaceae bacterium SG7u.111]|nr:beta-phosphoglucomutase [Flammeovirgaceae bacterium SG7u.132]WPO36327.1 beta-phosphoglucomutase [Flammeovirgaceae bacterium SG7u.111]